MDSRYSFSLTTFSPSGKLVQIEYALNAVNAGATALGIKGTDTRRRRPWCHSVLPSLLRVSPTLKHNTAQDGVVMATEKKLPPLIDETSIQKINLLTDSIGVVYAGMGPDSRVLVRKARKIAQQYYKTYRAPIPVNQIVRELAAIMQEFTQSGSVRSSVAIASSLILLTPTGSFYSVHYRGVRPFGVSLLIAGFDEVAGPQLYQVDPSGSYWAWKASAIGKGMVNARTFLEKRYVASNCRVERHLSEAIGLIAFSFLLFTTTVTRKT